MVKGDDGGETASAETSSIVRLVLTLVVVFRVQVPLPKQRIHCFQTQTRNGVPITSTV